MALTENDKLGMDIVSLAAAFGGEERCVMTLRTSAREMDNDIIKYLFLEQITPPAF